VTVQRCLVFGLVLVLAACGGAGGPQLVEGAAPGGVPLTPEHTLTAGDEFDIRLPFAADYNDHVTVGMDGNVAPKQIGDVRVGGLTVPEATGRLKTRYAKLLKAPDLSITMRRFAPEVIYVDGWVAKPGLIRSDIPLTLERAIIRAGGVKLGAKKSAIMIMRREENGTLRTYEAAAGGYFGGPSLGDDPLLKSFDVVYVPQTPIAAVADFARQYYANVPFSASFNVAPAPAAQIIAPPALTPVAPAAVTPR
jgi:protein involved in polysaccharide export with SLBB domain